VEVSDSVSGSTAPEILSAHNNGESNNDLHYAKFAHQHSAVLSLSGKFTSSLSIFVLKLALNTEKSPNLKAKETLNRPHYVNFVYIGDNQMNTPSVVRVNEIIKS